MKFENKELILFDLDGTLIDSAPDLALALNYTLKQINYTTFSEDLIRSWVGNGAQTLVKRALLGKSEIDENDINNDIFEKALAIFLEFYSQNLVVKTVMYPDVEQTLRSLVDNNYKLALVTNKPYDFIDPILKGLEIDNLFDLCIGGDSLDVKKPDPSPLLYVANKLNIDIQNCVMIGDSKNDILAANSANMHSIGVSYGYNYNEDILVYKPTLKVDNFSDILISLKR